MDFKPVIHEIFDQLTALASSMPNQDYSQQLKVLNGASIGQHVRHTLEFFKCLLAGREDGVVNYDDRRRDLFLESNTLEALTCIKVLKSQVEELHDNCPMTLMQCYGVGGEPFELETNLYRELIYNIEHAVHHMALIRIGVQHLKSKLKLPANFGIASSTMKYRDSQLRRN
ncbi:MAG: DinB family protein [Reichenbachiella sp.]